MADNSRNNPLKNIPGIGMEMYGKYKPLNITFPEPVLQQIRETEYDSPTELTMQDKVRLAVYYIFPRPGKENLTRKYIASIIEVPYPEESPKTVTLSKIEELAILLGEEELNERTFQSKQEEILFSTIRDILIEIPKSSRMKILETLIPLAIPHKRKYLEELIWKLKSLSI
jgi:hypothetical protein